MAKKERPSLVAHLKNFEAILRQTKQHPDIDLKKVNRLRKAIRNGEYEIDFEKLAEKLLKEY